jgi:hypothetical protein
LELVGISLQTGEFLLQLLQWIAVFVQFFPAVVFKKRRR